MELVGYLAAALIGTSLGLIGAGGSILTVPVMVYLFHVPVLLASSYSLAIVGFASLLGAAGKYRQGNVCTRTALVFGFTSAATVSLVRGVLIPIIPRELFAVNGVAVESSVISMVLFSVLMIVAARAMIRRKRDIVEPRSGAGTNLPGLLLSGIAVGLVTGLLGAGGGFLLIPVLVLLLRLPMKEAVGTSLLIIALNSLIGFAVDLSHFRVDWEFLASLMAVAGLGIFAGISLGKKLSAQKLRTVFGWFVLTMGLVILLRELLSFVSRAGRS